MKKLIVLSADAMVFEDVEYLSRLPNYKKYLEGGSWIKKVQSIYPSVTYPCHVTMMTGAWPDKHGVTSNFTISEGIKNPLPWRWFYDLEGVDDIFSAAKRSGLKTAAVFWPVTGRHPDIDYLIDEYWTQGPEDSVSAAFERSGSCREVLEIVNRHKDKLVERVHPMCDEFLISCACDIIRQKSPDLIMIHPANIDAYRHENGLFHDKVRRGIEETDHYIGAVMKAAEEAGIADEVNLVVTSDHGQLDIRRIVNLNVLFADRGLILVDGQGNVADWKAYCLSNGLSALVYLKDPADQAVYKETECILHEIKEEGKCGISQVFTEEEARKTYHLGGGFSFVLESDGATSIGSAYTGPLMSSFDTADYRKGRATHGHIPTKGPQPTFLAKGPDFKEHTVIEHALLIDEAPTYAKLLGVSLKDADGRPVSEILR